MTAKKGTYILTTIGLLLGITLDLLIRNSSTTVFYYSLITLFCLLYAFAYNGKNQIRLAGTSLLVALFLSLPLIPFKIDLSSNHYLHLFTFLLGFPFFVYVAHSFHYAYHHDNTWRIKYSSLFAAVWNTLPLIFVASIFCSLTNMIIMLGAVLFKTVGSDFLWKLYFHNHHFNLISSSTVFFIGLSIGQEQIKLIYNLRFLLLRIMYYLFPFLALHSIIYFVMYNIHSFYGEKVFISSIIVLIPLTSLGIIFFNACYQDGTVELKYPAWIQFFLRVYRVVLFILFLILTYKISNEYSLDSNLCVYLLVGLLFSINYAITAWFSAEKEKKWIYIGNIGTAILFIISVFLFNIPYLPLDFTLGVNHPPVEPILSVFGVRNS
ncbi:hypothetical protein [Legionella quateirensis]|uniref:Uncharacterized protein n=1 Tax=Legionella quateirensis TaxID=45072 RepID=A0A378KRA7_9GAMM|nr:hypothetical protein [Legionella quateirensis]KTD42440.1 hypothetical protein Lqua_3418 [Legionella quateirensis]STY17105.1 Uncharacterised protein [Legionella quateirensis]